MYSAQRPVNQSRMRPYCVRNTNKQTNKLNLAIDPIDRIQLKNRSARQVLDSIRIVPPTRSDIIGTIGKR